MKVLARALAIAFVVALATACPTEPPAPGSGSSSASPTPATAAGSAAPGTATGATAYPPIPPVPLGVEAPYVPESNPMTPAKVALGKALFFDKRISGDGTQACATCHPADTAWADGKALSMAVGNKETPRHTPSMLNKAWDLALYWDGRAANGMELQAVAPVRGFLAADMDKTIATLNGIASYKKLFEDSFGDDAITEERIGMALATFERTLLSGNSAFDKFEAGDATAMSDDAKKGWELFRGKAACGTCHAGFAFTDATGATGDPESAAATDVAGMKFHNVGIGMDGDTPRDVGRFKITEDPAHTGAFKTPSLRDVARTAPYFHDGSVATLEEAVRFMAGGGKASKFRDPDLKDAKLTDEEIKQLVAFLEALNSDLP